MQLDKSNELRLIRHELDVFILKLLERRLPQNISQSDQTDIADPPLVLAIAVALRSVSVTPFPVSRNRQTILEPFDLAQSVQQSSRVVLSGRNVPYTSSSSCSASGNSSAPPSNHCLYVLDEKSHKSRSSRLG